MVEAISLYDKAKTLNNDQLRSLIRSGEFKGQTAGLSKNMLQILLSFALQIRLTQWYGHFKRQPDIAQI